MKKIISGFILGMFLTSIITVFSASAIKSAMFNDIIKLEVDGKPVNSELVTVVLDGQENGSNYVPARALVEAMGGNVEWDGVNKKIVVTTKGNLLAQAFDVTNVIDGDTFKIMYGGKEVSVRLIGVDTPESVHPDATKNTEFGKVAAEYTKNKLTGKKVRLVKDVSETDKYGRLLRYVYFEDGTFFNELLVKEGYAKVATYAPDVKFADVFVKAEQYARQNNKGLWSLTDNQTTPTSTPTNHGLIKGNISSTGEKIYHVPGGAYYDKTVAEEWFYTEEEAQAAGYRKSQR